MALDALFKHNPSFYSDSLIQPRDALGHTIRLLCIQPGCFEDPLAYELSTVEFNERIEYTALSYVWGKHEVPQTVKLNGKPDLWVTRNAFVAMRRLRQHNEDGVTIWIDAICIKQIDLEERSVRPWYHEWRWYVW